MRYRFIEAHKKVWPVNLMCQVLQVARSGHYAWLKRADGARMASNRTLDGDIRRVFAVTSNAMARRGS